MKNENVKYLNEIKMDLSMRDQFYYMFLSFINISFDKYEQVDTAALYRTNNNIIGIDINTNFWNSLDSNSERLFILKHELLHLAFKHVHIIYINNYNKEMYGLACDFYINNILCKDPYCKKVEGGAFYENYDIPKAIVESNTVDIYNYIMNNKELKNKLSNDFNCDKSHSNWDDFNKELINVSIDNVIKQCASTGNIPNELRNVIDSINNFYKKDIDYKSVLRKSITANASRTKIKRTYLRDNFYYEESPGTRIKYNGIIPFIIDTSGSMSNVEDINDICDQLIAVSKQTNLLLKVIECDCNVTDKSVWKYKNFSDLKKRMKDGGFVGGGGTSLDPAISYINENIPHTKVAVYVTDGYVNKPIISHNYKIIVVITKSSKTSIKKFAEEWGSNYQILKIEK